MTTKTGLKGHEQRKLPRVSIPDHPQILDTHSNTVVGQLVNLSAEGLMMMSASPIKPGTLLQCRIPLHCNKAVIEIAIGIESLWCDDTDESGICWTGFHIIDISPEQYKIISALVYDQ